MKKRAKAKATTPANMTRAQLRARLAAVEKKLLEFMAMSEVRKATPSETITHSSAASTAWTSLAGDEEE